MLLLRSQTYLKQKLKYVSKSFYPSYCGILIPVLYNLDSKCYFISTWVKISYFFVTFQIISKSCVSAFNCLAVNMISLIFLTRRRVRNGFHLQLAGLSGYNMLTLMTMLFIFGLPQLYDTYTSVVYPILFPIT